MKEHNIQVEKIERGEVRVHVNVKNPLSGLDNNVTVVITGEGIIVDMWGDEASETAATMYQLWDDLAEYDETDKEKETT